MFKNARKLAGLSIESAALDLHIGTRTLTNYEQGHTMTPPDVALKMSEVYGQPALAAKYCAENCPIGQRYAHRVQEKDLASSVLSLLKEFNDVKKLKDDLVDISADGIIDEDERPTMEYIVKELQELDQAIDTLMWWARTQLKQTPAPAKVAEKRVPYQTKKKAACGAAR